jgi:truncated hemoglobin YjbI
MFAGRLLGPPAQFTQRRRRRWAAAAARAACAVVLRAAVREHLIQTVVAV